MIEHLLNDAPNSNGQTLICDTIDNALAILETTQLSTLQGDTLPCNYKILVQRWSVLPAQETLISDLLGHLARVALGLWPHWYGLNGYGLDDLSMIRRFTATLQVETQIQTLLHHLQTHAPAQVSSLSLSWLQAASDQCRHGTEPLLTRFPRELQFAQLAFAIEPHQLIILLAVDDPQPQPFHLYGLARALAWISQATPARISLLLPTTLADHPELESVLYNAIRITPSPATATPTHDTVIQTTPLSASITKQESFSSNEDTEQQKGFIWPIRGQPHPFSPGEQLLAMRLAVDSELGPLFQCNATVHSVRGAQYLVDLLWKAGRVVVEIDGYQVHSKRPAFSADRQRDYELLISGYLVLRLSHDEVMQDVVLAVEKIRDVVRFRKTKL